MNATADKAHTNGHAGGKSARDQAREAYANRKPRDEAKPKILTAVSRCVDAIEEKVLPWFWKGFFPDHNLTIVSGRGGVGKGYLWADLVARITTTGEMPDGSFSKVGPVILAVAEDSLEYTIKARLRVNGADLSKIHTLEGIVARGEDGKDLDIAFTLEHVGVLEELIERIKPVAVVVDPIGSFIPGDVDINVDNQVRAILTPLARLAEKHKFAGIIVAHHRKSSSESADDMVLAGRAFTALCRASFHVFDDDGRKMFLRGKGNLSMSRAGMAYRIERTDDNAGRVVWESEPVELDADDYLADQSKPGMEPDARDDAVDWLRATIGDGSMTKSELKDRRNRDGVPFSWRTAERAMKDAKVKCERDAHTGKYVYRLLKDADNRPQPLEDDDA